VPAVYNNRVSWWTWLADKLDLEIYAPFRKESRLTNGIINFELAFLAVYLKLEFPIWRQSFNIFSSKSEEWKFNNIIVFRKVRSIQKYVITYWSDAKGTEKSITKPRKKHVNAS
jgi:hypothetical protein